MSAPSSRASRRRSGPASSSTPPAPRRSNSRSPPAPSPSRSPSRPNAAALQTDTGLRKTIESKDIEQLSFSGRNPIGVAGLKPGVIGGNFNNYGFSDLGNGGFNINGSRSDENNITVDGATAIRTRSSGAIVGIQNVDAIQEVQVLTGNYMPEYGRASGGQIRMVTKSGSNRFSGSRLGFYYRDDKLQANTWARNRSPLATENSGPAPFDYKQYGYSIGGPIPVACSRTSCSSSARRSGSTTSRSVPTPPPCRPPRCAPATSASCSTPTTFFSSRAQSSATR